MKTTIVTVDGVEYELVQVKENDSTWRSRSGATPKKFGAAFEVRTMSGELLGTIEHRLVTRETKSKGKRYVNNRWESPGWSCRIGGTGRSRVESSRRYAIENIVRG